MVELCIICVRPYLRSFRSARQFQGLRQRSGRRFCSSHAFYSLIFMLPVESNGSDTTNFSKDNKPQNYMMVSTVKDKKSNYMVISTAKEASWG